MLAIGIDISKATFHASFDDLLVKKFKNTEDGIAAFLTALPSLGHSATETVIGVESTGVYHLLFCSRVSAARFRIMVMNPLESHHFMAAHSLRERKTDKIDAHVIRTMVQSGVGRPFI